MHNNVTVAPAQGIIAKHFVTFVSPGTFVPETTTQGIDAWDVEEAKRRATSIRERYGAVPYSFHFTTRSRGPDDLDSRQTARSVNYFLGGVIETREEIEARNDPKEAILRSNLRNQNVERVLTNTNSWRVTVPLQDGDVILEWAPLASLTRENENE